MHWAAQAFPRNETNNLSYLKKRVSQNENYLSKSNVILSGAKNLVCINLCIRDPSLRLG